MRLYSNTFVLYSLKRSLFWKLIDYGCIKNVAQKTFSYDILKSYTYNIRSSRAILHFKIVFYNNVL